MTFAISCIIRYNWWLRLIHQKIVPRPGPGAQEDLRPLWLLEESVSRQRLHITNPEWLTDLFAELDLQIAAGFEILLLAPAFLWQVVEKSGSMLSLFSH